MSTMIDLPPLTIAALRRYVEGLPAHMPCGERFSPRRCLVARYLNEQLSPLSSVTVLHASIWIFAYDPANPDTAVTRKIATPVAISRLLTRFDQLGIEYPLPAEVLPIFKPGWTPT